MGGVGTGFPVILCHSLQKQTTPGSATIATETSDAEKRVGIASVRGRSRGGGWWGGWRSPPPWPVASSRSLPSQQLRMAAARVRRRRDWEFGIGDFGCAEGRVGREGGKSQKDSAVGEGKSSSNALVLGVASERRRVTSLVQRRLRPKLARGPARIGGRRA